MRYCGNKICPDKQTNKQTDEWMGQAENNAFDDTFG